MGTSKITARAPISKEGDGPGGGGGRQGGATPPPPAADRAKAFDARLFRFWVLGRSCCSESGGMRVPAARRSNNPGIRENYDTLSQTLSLRSGLGCLSWHPCFSDASASSVLAAWLPAWLPGSRLGCLAACLAAQMPARLPGRLLGCPAASHCAGSDTRHEDIYHLTSQTCAQDGIPNMLAITEVERADLIEELTCTSQHLRYDNEVSYRYLGCVMRTLF